MSTAPAINSLKARQTSVILYTDANDDIASMDTMRIENLAECIKITPSQATILINKLKACR